MANEFNDEIVTEGFPEGWFVENRLQENEALLCRKSDFALDGWICICARPKAIPTAAWLSTARIIAHGFDAAYDRPRSVTSEHECGLNGAMNGICLICGEVE